MPLAPDAAELHERAVRHLEMLLWRAPQPQPIGGEAKLDRTNAAIRLRAWKTAETGYVSLQEIGRQLQAMAIPSARGHLTWSASMVAQLLKPTALDTVKHNASLRVGTLHLGRTAYGA